MKLNLRSPLTLIIVLLLFSAIYWLLPISGQIAYIPPSDGSQQADAVFNMRNSQWVSK